MNIQALVGGVIVFIFISLVSILFHEIGHTFALTRIAGRKIRVRWDNKKWRLKCGTPSDYASLTKEKYRIVIVSGIVAGFIIFYPFYLFRVNGWVLLASLIFYVVGCRNDILYLADSFDINLRLNKD